MMIVPFFLPFISSSFLSSPSSSFFSSSSSLSSSSSSSTSFSFSSSSSFSYSSSFFFSSSFFLFLVFSLASMGLVLFLLNLALFSLERRMMREWINMWFWRFDDSRDDSRMVCIWLRASSSFCMKMSSSGKLTKKKSGSNR